MTVSAKTVAVAAALASLCSLTVLSPTPSSAQGQMLKLNSGAGLPVCQNVVTGRYVICFIPTSVCLAHGGHIDYDPRDTSGSPHCMGSDLVAKKQ